MASFTIKTPQREYRAIVQRGNLARIGHYIPQRSGRIFVVTNQEIWRRHGGKVARSLEHNAHDVLFLPDGEEHKRLANVEAAAEEMVRKGADRSSLVVAFGGGIVSDVAGFLAAIFMRGIPVV